MGGHCLEETAADDRNKSTMLEKFSIKHYLRKEQEINNGESYMGLLLWIVSFLLL